MRKYNSSMLCRITVVFLAAALIFGMAITVYAAGATVDAISLDGLPSAAGSNLKVGYTWSCGHNNGTANVSATNNTIVCTANGRYSLLGTDYATTLTVTLTNNSTIEKTLKFNLTVNSSDGSVTLAGSSVKENQNTPHDFTLAAGGSVQLVIVTAKSKDENKVTLSNVTLTSDAVTKVKYVAPVDQAGNVLGSYTLNGNSVVGTTVDYSTETAIATFAVTPKTGYKHVGWKTESGADIGNTSDLTTILKPDVSEDANGDGVVEVYPFLVPTSAATYRVDNQYYYYWQDAMTAAAASSSKLVTVVANGTLPGGTANNWVADTSDGNTANDYAVANSDGTVTYYVPSGIKFLVPYSAEDDGTFAGGENYTDKATSNPSAFRTLTVAAGAHIICNGEMNVNGQRHEYTQPHSGRPAGGHGLMKLEGSGTQLTVNGTLFCYGFIAGTGQVVVNGTMHELLQMAAWNGGSYSTDWAGKADNSTVLFLSSFYVQNVEAPLRVNAGANVYAETVITGTIPVVNKEVSVRRSCAFIMPYTASEGLFLLDTGTYITRTYDPATDRVAYTIGKDSGNGNVKFGSIVITAGIPVIGNITIDSASYVLPVTSAMDVTFDTGVVLSFTNKVAVLPGGKVIIADGAKVNLSNTMYLFDLSDWTKTMAYPTDVVAVPQYYTVARKTTKKLTVTESAYLEVNGDLNIASGGGIYTTNGLFGQDADGNEVLGAASTNADKIIYGTGTITHAAAQANPYVISTNTSGVTLKAGYDSTLHRINLTHAVGHLAGYTGIVDESPYHAFAFAANKPFYGLGKDYNHYWYQHVIMVEGGVEGVIPHGSSIGETGGYTSGIRSITTGGEKTNSNVVGYAVDGGTFSFTIDPLKVCSVTGLVADENGVYTISNITADRTITLVEHTPGPAATCTTAQTCTVCQKVLVEALGHNAVTDAKVEPACTETGLTEGSHCDRCGEVLVAQEEIAALNHIEVIDAAVAPTCTEDGLTEGKHCDRCGEVLVAQTKVEARGYHTWKDGTCTVPDCGAHFYIPSTSVVIGQGLDLYFYVNKADVAQPDAVFCIDITKTYADGRADKTVTYTITKDYLCNEDTQYRFSFSDIPAKEMTDDITAVVYYKDGDKASFSLTDSVQKYAHRAYEQFGAADSTLGPALADMLNYGAACQTLFGYNTEKMANDPTGFTKGEELMAKATTDTIGFGEDGHKKGEYYYASTFSAKNQLMFTFYFDFDPDNDGNHDIDEKSYAIVTYYDPAGKAIEKRVDLADWYYRKSGDEYLFGIDVVGIPLAWGDTVIKCDVYAGDGSVISTGNVDSIVYYAARKGSQNPALYDATQTLMRFIDSVKLYAKVV